MRIPFPTTALLILVGHLPAAAVPSDPHPVPPPPSSAPMVVITGESVLDLVLPPFTDPLRGVLTYRLEGLPTGLSFDPSTRTISGTSTAIGTFPLTLVAVDGQGSTATWPTSLVVMRFEKGVQRHFYRDAATHPRNFVRVFPPTDQAPHPQATPAVVFIHGGGWTGGHPEVWSIRDRLRQRGITCITVTYRLLGHSHRDGAVPPVAGTMDDIRRAFQFIRSRAGEWGIDPNRIAVTGGSAGACAALLLALDDDHADAASPDAVARESTRPLLAAVGNPQTTLDPEQVEAWIPTLKSINQRSDICYGSHAFGIVDPIRSVPSEDLLFSRNFILNRSSFERFMTWFRASGTNRKLVESFSPWHLATADDPAIFMTFTNAPGKTYEPFRAHAPEYGEPLRKRLSELGVPCELVLPAREYPAEMKAAGLIADAPARTDAHADEFDYLTAKLLGDHAPLAPVLADQLLAAGRSWTWKVPEFSDPDLDVLHYSVTGLPPGLMFDPRTRTISGTPGASGSFAIQVSVHDYRGGAATAACSLVIAEGAPR